MKNKKGLAFLFVSTGILFSASGYGRIQARIPNELIAPVEPKPFPPTDTPIKSIAQRKKELTRQIKNLEARIDLATKNKERLQRYRDMGKRQLKELLITRG